MSGDANPDSHLAEHDGDDLPVGLEQGERVVEDARIARVRDRHPHGLARGHVPARLRDPPQMPDAPVAGRVADEQLAAPDRPVIAEAQAVEGEAEHRALQSVLGHRGRDVRVVMLDRDGGHSQLLREPGARQVGMQVVRDQLGLHAEDLTVPVERLAEGTHGLLGVEVADVLG